MYADQKLAKEFSSKAEDFRLAAERLNTKPFLYSPTFYCALHSIELSLKAHLALAGFSKSCLKLLGHDIGALITEAHNAKIVPFLDRSARNTIKRGSKDYSQKGFEYPEFMVSTHPIGVWLRIAKDLTSNIMILCK